jgi:hypothetical protein
LGQIIDSLDEGNSPEHVTYEQLKVALKRTPVPLTQSEQQAVAMANARAAQYVVGLGNRVSQQTGAILIEADASLRRQLRDTIRTNTERNIAARETVRQLRSDLGHATGDWTRDLDRIAMTEKQTAMQEGTAAAIAKRRGPKARVAKLYAPNCCDNCRRLYQGQDGAPRIFELSELEDNGTNVGRKVAEWLPVVGTTHPHCLCTLISVPDGWGFGAGNDLEPDGMRGIYAARSAKSIRITAPEAFRKAAILRGKPPRIRLRPPKRRHMEDDGPPSGTSTHYATLTKTAAKPVC